MGDIITFPGSPPATALARPGSAEPIAALLGRCHERVRTARSAIQPIEAYFERMNAVLAEAGEALRVSAARYAICHAALESGDIDTMLRARAALMSAAEP